MVMLSKQDFTIKIQGGNLTMNKKTNKVISLLLMICLILSMMPMTAMADESFGIFSIAGVEITIGDGIGTEDVPIIATVIVPYMTDSIDSSNINTVTTISVDDIIFSKVIPFPDESNPNHEISLSYGENHFYIRLTNGGHFLYYDMTVTRQIKPVGGWLIIGSESAQDLTANASGTNWSWDASKAILTLTGDINGDGAIIFYSDSTGYIEINGNVKASALWHASNGIIIRGNGTLTVNHTVNDGNPAIVAGSNLDIEDITVNASTSGNDCPIILVKDGDFGIDNSMLTLSATGENVTGVMCNTDGLIVSKKGIIHTEPDFHGIVLDSKYYIEISGTVDITSTNSTAIKSDNNIIINEGGKVTAKGAGPLGAISVGATYNIEVNEGTLITGDSAGLNGNVSGNINACDPAAQVTINGNIIDGGDLTVSDGLVTVTGTVSGSQNFTGGTVWVNGVNVYQAGITTYAVYVIDGIANPTTAKAGQTVTINANAAPGGQRFDEWMVVSGSAILANSKASTTTFVMPEDEVKLVATYDALPIDTYSINVSTDSNGVAKTNVNFAKDGDIIELDATSNSGYLFKEWEVISGNVTIINNKFTMPASNVIIKANFKPVIVNPSQGGGGSSGGGSSTPPVVSKHDITKPSSPTTAFVDIKADNTGSVSISDSTIANVIKTAQEKAKKDGTEENGISLELNITGVTNGDNININLSKSVQDQLVKDGVKTVVIKQNGMELNLDLEVFKSIQASNGDVNLTVSKKDITKLSKEAQSAIGSRPVYEINIKTADGKDITSFGNGEFSMEIPYVLGKNENPENLFGIYVNTTGEIEWLKDSNYDAKTQKLHFTTNHLSTYGIGYKVEKININFSDITNHWAKDDIEFVVSQGLFSGIGEGKFAPDLSMTRGMFVTALGRMAKADVSSYKTSKFADVKTDAYYMGYVEWAAKNNIVNGVGENNFAPDKSITREQMAVIITSYAKSIGFDLLKINKENIFADSSNTSSYAKEAVKYMQIAGIISGKNDNQFDPQGTATRAEVSAVLKRFITLIDSSDKAQD